MRLMRQATGLMLDLSGTRSGQARRTGIPHDRPKPSRLLAGAAALLLLVTAGACGPSHGGTPSAPGGTPSAPGAVSIPTGNLSAHDQCMLNAGWKISAVESGYPGEPPLNVLSSDPNMDPQEAMAGAKKCESLLPPPVPLTEAEIRVIYDRWVGEYHCMVGLGYQPDPPPSVETFVASWDGGPEHDKGPWMPIAGVDTDHWKQSQYDEAKAKCTLEFFNAEGLPQ